MKTTKTPAASTKSTKSKVTVKVATSNPPSPAKASTTKAKAKGTTEIPADAIAKMTKWNEGHPDKAFSWVIVSAELPAAKRTCRTCKKEFREGRLTRVDSTGAYCGPRCQLKSAK